MSDDAELNEATKPFPSVILPDRWYLYFACKTCMKPIAFMLLASGDVPAGGDGDFTFTDRLCQHCLITHDYSMAEVKRMRSASHPAKPEPSH